MTNNKNTNFQLTKRRAIKWLFRKKFFKKFLLTDSLGEMPPQMYEKKSPSLFAQIK